MKEYLNINNPRISVIMPVYNAEKYVSIAIESVLVQTFSDFEFIIIDDCSTDNSLKIIKKFASTDKRIIILTNSANLRICKTLNKGINNAKGKYIVRMDADDYSYPYRFKIQYEFMENNPKINVSGGAIEVCNEKLRPIKQRNYQIDDKNIRKKMFFSNPFAHPAVIYRRKDIEYVNLYNEDLADAEDYDLYFRLGRIGQFGNVADKLIKYRISSSQVSIQKSRRQELLTLYIRLKAVAEYGYEFKFHIFLYSLLQFISVFIIPSRLKLKIYNFFRK